MKQLQKQEIIPKDFNITDIPFCEPCVLGKMVNAPFPNQNHKPNAPLDIVVSDICGPFPVISHDGYRYVITFMDLYSGFSKICLLKYKSDAFYAYKNYNMEVSTLFGRHIKILRTDGGQEYQSTDLLHFLATEGTVHQVTVPYTPEQNGNAERLNRTLLDKVRCMLVESSAPQNLWSEAIRTANYLRNLLPSAAYQFKTPYELWFHKKPDISHLQTFGVDAYSLVPKIKRSKLDSKGERCKMLGYETKTKGYRLWSLSSQKVIISRSVRFHENSFSLPWQEVNAKSERMDPVERHVSFDIPSLHPQTDTQDMSDDEYVDAEEEVGPTIEVENKSRPQRARRMPDRYDPSALNIDYPEILLARSLAERKTQYLNSCDTPLTYKQAINSEFSTEWTLSMIKELQAMKRKNHKYKMGI
jgi:hypothetical protein